MAIGIRILSDNLSGMTANVTFLPTSGGTIDLGSQTIPFNYISPDPYGVYELYIPTYDYTYELEAKASVFTGESFTFSSRLTTNYNNGAVTLNFNDFTAEIIDLGVDYAGWNLTDLYPLTNLGYGYYFYNDNDYCWKWVVFTDVFGNIIDQYQAYTDCDDNWDDLGGKWLTFIDNYNGVLKYFNGENSYTYEFDASHLYLDIWTGWDGVTSNGNFVLKLEDSNTNTNKNYIVNKGTLTQYGSEYANGEIYNYMATYFSGNFVCRLVNDWNNNSLISFEIYNDTTGELLDSVSFPNATYWNYDLNFYGDNKMYVIFYSGSLYKIIHFDGNTSTMKILNHDQNTYPSYDNHSNSNFWPNNGGSESFVIVVYNQNTTNGLGHVVTYCDLIYMLSGDTDFNTYTFQDSGSPDKTISYGAITADNSIYIPCDNGDGLTSTLCITHSGVTYVTTTMISEYNEFYSVGNNFMNIIYSDNNYTGCTLNYISENGVLLDSISGITFNSSYEYRMRSVGDVFRFTNYGDTNVFINRTSTQFQNSYSLNNQDYNYDPNNQFRSDFIRPGVILTINETTKYSSIITSDTYVTGSTLPQSNGGFNIEVGEDKFMYVYYGFDGYVNIELYDFEYNLLNSQVTPYTNWWTSDSCGNRFYVIVEYNSEYIIYMVSDSIITSKSLTNNNSYSAFNDYINWD